MAYSYLLNSASPAAKLSMMASSYCIILSDMVLMSLLVRYRLREWSSYLVGDRLRVGVCSFCFIWGLIKLAERLAVTVVLTPPATVELLSRPLTLSANSPSTANRSV